MVDTKKGSKVTGRVLRDVVAIQPDWRKLERDLSTIKSATRMAIIDFLQKSPDKLSFEALARCTGVNPSNLAYHVSQLKKYGFITNEMRSERDGRCFSFYGLTKKGKDYLDFINTQLP